MRYLVTGGAGFIGSALIRKLILDKPILSDKDAISPMLKEFESPFVFGENS